MAAFFKPVLLFGVPRWRPPRLSPGLEPRGIAICYFAIFRIGRINNSLMPIPSALDRYSFEQYAAFIARLLLFFATSKIEFVNWAIAINDCIFGERTHQGIASTFS